MARFTIFIRRENAKEPAMMIDPHRFQISLSKRSIFTLPDAAGVGIECRSGSVWVTLDDDPRDIVLSAGERFEGGEHRRALVSALEPSCIAVTGAEPVGLGTAAAERPPWRLRAHALSPA
jgi:hypothetical protein